eukprot:10162888-Alexandrium_andersonii.AAC.1
MAAAAIIDTKTLGKPPQLIGESPQEYADWSFITRAYLRQVDKSTRRSVTSSTSSTRCRTTRRMA